MFTSHFKSNPINKKKEIVKNNKVNGKEGGRTMTKSQSQQERQWTVRKQDQNPHGKVKSKDELLKEAGRDK
jgi:hypothetical protein